MTGGHALIDWWMCSNDWDVLIGWWERSNDWWARSNDWDVLIDWLARSNDWWARSN